MRFKIYLFILLVALMILHSQYIEPVFYKNTVTGIEKEIAENNNIYENYDALVHAESDYDLYTIAKDKDINATLIGLLTSVKIKGEDIAITNNNDSYQIILFGSYQSCISALNLIYESVKYFAMDRLEITPAKDKPYGFVKIIMKGKIHAS